VPATEETSVNHESVERVRTLYTASLDISLYLYIFISLVQRMGVKSTIQNFDRSDGNFRKADFAWFLAGSWPKKPWIMVFNPEHRKTSFLAQNNSAILSF
jgi:hypothetical protein